jgi:hypothetical protein
MRRSLVAGLTAALMFLVLPWVAFADRGGQTSQENLPDGQRETMYVTDGGGVGPSAGGVAAPGPAATPEPNCVPVQGWSVAGTAGDTTPVMRCKLPNLSDGAVDQGAQWVREQEASLEQRLSGGTVGVHPEAGRQFVNLPSMVFLTGAGVNGGGASLEQSVEIGGYRFTVTTGLVEVDWSWGDGTSDSMPGVDGLGQDVAPPRGESSVRHSYLRIGTYPVSATSVWAVAATMVDPQGRRTTITDATRSFRRTAQATFTVLQIEGVPARG